MNSLRRYGLCVTLVLTNVFAIPMVLSFSSNLAQNNLINIVIDFEESSDSSENQKTENKVEEDKSTYLNAISLRRGYLNICMEFGQLEIQHSMDVFLDIFKPPPEAS